MVDWESRKTRIPNHLPGHTEIPTLSCQLTSLTTIASRLPNLHAAPSLAAIDTITHTRESCHVSPKLFPVYRNSPIPSTSATRSPTVMPFSAFGQPPQQKAPLRQPCRQHRPDDLLEIQALPDYPQTTCHPTFHAAKIQEADYNQPEALTAAQHAAFSQHLKIQFTSSSQTTLTIRDRPRTDVKGDGSRSLTSQWSPCRRRRSSQSWRTGSLAGGVKWLQCNYKAMQKMLFVSHLAITLQPLAWQTPKLYNRNRRALETLRDACHMILKQGGVGISERQSTLPFAWATWIFLLIGRPGKLIMLCIVAESL